MRPGTLPTVIACVGGVLRKGRGRARWPKVWGAKVAESRATVWRGPVARSCNWPTSLGSPAALSARSLLECRNFGASRWQSHQVQPAQSRLAYFCRQELACLEASRGGVTQSESVVGLDRNGRRLRTGIAGAFALEYESNFGLADGPRSRPEGLVLGHCHPTTISTFTRTVQTCTHGPVSARVCRRVPLPVVLAPFVRTHRTDGAESLLRLNST